MSTTYKRGQVEWALWRFFTLGNRSADQPPRVFGTRIKRLLELDRAEEVEYCAFFESDPEGHGIDVEYTAFNAFCLAVAMDLLDMGFKQAEVVFLVQHIRRALLRAYRRILSSPPAIRQRMAAEDRSDCPTYEEKGVLWADCRVFMVVQKIEMTEVLPLNPRRKRTAGPIILQPTFCRGIEGLASELHRMNFDYRKAVVTELAYAATSINEFLDEAPEIKRGRK